MVEIRTRNKYWKCFICDEKYLTGELYKAELTNSVINYLFKDYNIRESNKRKGYTESEIISENNNSIFSTATLSSATGIIYDQIISEANKYAKSTITKSIFE